MSRLRRAGLPVSLIIAGEGPLRAQLQEQIRDLELSSCVSLPGALTQGELEQLYFSGLTAFVQPAIVAPDGDMDGIPVALMEAMARGLPVISCSVSGIPELIEHEVSGLLTEPVDARALEAAVLRLIQEPELGIKLGEAACARVASAFELGKSVEGLLTAWQKSAFVPGSAVL